jgi:hypothetical protein
MHVNLRNHLDNGTNLGYLTAENGGNTSLLAVGVEPGTAYVKGYEINKLVTEYVATDKGTDYLVSSGQTLKPSLGNYVLVNEFVGSWDFNSGSQVALYNTAQTRISGRKWSTSAQTGTQIGTARVRAVVLDTGVMGVSTTTYRVYLYDINMTSGAFTAVRSIYFNDSSKADWGADIVLTGGVAVLQESDFLGAVYPLSTPFVRSIRDGSGTIETTYPFLKTFTVSIGTDGTFSLTTGLADETFPYSIGALDSAEKRQILISMDASATVAMSGTVTGTSGTAALTGSGTSFTNLTVGDKITITGVSGVYFVASITNNVSMTVSPVLASSPAGATWNKIYEVGDIIDFTQDGATGIARTVSASSATALSFDMKETLSATTAATATVVLNKASAREIKKTIRKNRYVKLDLATNSGGTTGPWNLGLSDVYRIVSVRKATAFTTPTDGVDVTDSFILDNGQRDSHYDNAKLYLNGLTLSSSDDLLVCVDYFFHDYSQGSGYYSVDSYPIDDVNGYANTSAIATEDIPLYRSLSTGLTYDLRNCIDTRPSKTNTATDTTSLTSISTNPAASSSMESPTGGLHLMVPDETISLDYSYYLPRKDLVLLHQNGSISVVRGIPDTVPITPKTPDDSMSLATINIAPWPSLTQTVAANKGRLDLACSILKTAYKRYTMRDIGVLEDRIDNLEYYTALSLLEKNTLDMVIPDDNGLNRFKNGIFVDPFQNLSLGDLNNPDFRIACDPNEQSIRPVFDVNSVKLKYSNGTGVVNANNLVMLSYTETVFAQQPYASDIRNASGQYYRYKGFMDIDPSGDFWVDTSTVPSIQASFGQNASWQSLENAWGTQWNDWQTIWSGAPQTSTTSVTQDVDPGFNSMHQTVTTTATTTTTSGQSRSGQKLNVTTQTQTQNLGDRVVDVSLVPYIRPQTIKCKAYGMKPSSRHYVFFDGEAMSSYCTPTNSSYAATGTEGSNLTTDAQGTIYFLLRLPTTGKQFRVGDKNVYICDNFNNTSDAITSSAETSFNALGMNQTKQDVILSTTTPTFSTESVYQTRTIQNTTQSTSFSVIPNPNYIPASQSTNGGDGGEGGDPLGQTFMVSLVTPIPGVFLTSIDLFFQQKDPVYGVTVETRVGDNSGNISRLVVPYSRNYLPPSAINVSEDGSVPTRFYFKSPIYLQNGQEYAIVVKPEANNPNTVVWTAVLGNTDKITKKRITTQPYSGVFFVSSNNSSWSAIQTEDLKFTLYRAAFNVGTGSVTTVNDSVENMFMSSVTGDWTLIGEQIKGESRVTLNNIVGGTIANTYIIKGNTSGANGQIVKISGSTYNIRGVLPGKAYTVGETVAVRYANNATTGITAQVATLTIPTGTLSKYQAISASNNVLQMSDVAGTFALGEQIRGQTSNAYGTIGTLNNYKFSTLDLESASIIVNGTAIDWTTKTTSNTYVLDSAATSITAGHNKYLTEERMVVSNSNEATYMSGAKSLVATASLTTGSEYVSPVIDLNKTYTVIVHNIINNDTTGETNKSGGNAVDRYISQKVTLADGQDAEDLHVYISAYKPTGSNIFVYAKFLNGEDSNSFEDRPWIAMTLNSKDAFGITDNINDIKDYDYVFSASIKTGSNGEVQYTNTNGVLFTGFKYFAIKIVLVSTDSAVVPRILDLRSIALQV